MWGALISKCRCWNLQSKRVHLTSRLTHSLPRASPHAPPSVTHLLPTPSNAFAALPSPPTDVQPIQVDLRVTPTRFRKRARSQARCGEPAGRSRRDAPVQERVGPHRRLLEQSGAESITLGDERRGVLCPGVTKLVLAIAELNLAFLLYASVKKVEYWRYI